MSLRVWLPLTKDLGNQGLDKVTVTNNGATFNSTGKLGGCYSFSGSSQKIVNTLSPTITSSVGSLSCWIKMNSLPGSSSFYNLMQLGNLGGYATCRLGLYMEYTNKINISIDGSSTGANVYTHSLVANQWYHICATYNGTIVKLYIDGNEVLSKTASKGSYTTAASYLYVGGTSSYYLNGYMNDARYYDHALSPLEVKQISQGLILHYPLNREGWGNENLLKNTNVSVTNGSKTGFVLSQTIPSGTKVTFSLQVDAINLVLSGNKRIGLEGYQNNGTNNSYKGVWITGANAQGTYSKRIFATVTLDRDFFINNSTFGIYIQTVSSGSVTISNPKIEIGEKATLWCPNSADELATTLKLNNNVEYDTSGYGNNGTKIGSFSYDSDTPKYNVSTIFNGTNSYITINPLIIDMNTVSFVIWVKWDNFNSYSRIWDFGQAASGGGYCCFLMNDATNGSIKLRLRNASGNELLNYNFITANINTWYHIAFTLSNTTCKVYVNGVLKDTKILSSNIGTAIFNYPYIGKSNWSTDALLDGKLSDFRIYATALSADDIKSLYNNSAYIDNQGNIYGALYEEV